MANHGILSASAALLSLLFVLTIASMVSAATLSDLGGPCRFTGECKEGFCLNSTCRYPSILEKYALNGTCTYSAECQNGFCKDGECVVPNREEGLTLTFGAKSGCAGIIDNCTGYACLLCDFSWILLLVTASIASFVGRKKGRMLPIMLFGLPLLMGFLIFPILGFILAIIEVFVLALLKKPMVNEL
jgi:hypothetical protein